MKIILIVGTGSSGSGAISDFLTKSTKYKNPFKGQEFRIIDDPDGILNMYYNFYINHSINNPSNAIMRFKNYIENLINLKVKINNKQTNVYDKKILPITNEYIRNITTLSYHAYPQFIEIQTSFFKRKFFNFKKKISQSKGGGNLFNMYLPVKKEIFLKQSKNYLRKIIQCHSQSKKINHIILDQSLNMWNFTEIFSYFDDVKIILVTRDPRGIFNSMKNRDAKAYPGYNLKIWTKWYEQIMHKFINYKKKIPKKYKKYVLEIKFEDFCRNYESEQYKVLNFLNTKKINDNFDIKNSKFNVFKAKKELSVFEKNYIKKKLSKYLQW